MPSSGNIDEELVAKQEDHEVNDTNDALGAEEMKDTDANDEDHSDIEENPNIEQQTVENNGIDLRSDEFHDEKDENEMDVDSDLDMGSEGSVDDQFEENTDALLDEKGSLDQENSSDNENLEGIIGSILII